LSFPDVHTDAHAERDGKDGAEDERSTGEGHRAPGHQLLQLGEGHHRPAERHRTDDQSEDSRGERQALVGAGELEQRDEGRGPAADAVEDGDELRHRGHAHPAGDERADHGAGRHGGKDRRDVVQPFDGEDDDHGEQRASGADQVAVACRTRGREPL
jgi:hypothetical protein